MPNQKTDVAAFVTAYVSEQLKILGWYVVDQTAGPFGSHSSTARRHSAGIPSTPTRLPTKAPTIAAFVSASPPRLAAASTASRNTDRCSISQNASRNATRTKPGDRAS